MPTFFSISLFLLLFSCVYLPLTSATATHNRRALHEPFLPQDSNQAPAPQPPTRKYPFSTSTPDKQPSPFFPSVPFPPSPPSPPAPPTFASYPANISSLVLPQSPKSKSGSSKFIAVAVALVASAGILISICIFIYIRRWRRRRETKADGSENSNGVFHASGLPRPRRSPQNSSEFLYLGTMVNSQGGVGPNVAPSCGGGDVDLRKLHSPELRPLPPLAQQSLRLNYENADAVGSSDEEFYSPRESSAGHESSIGTESASRTAFTALATDNFDASRSESNSSLYTSSSNSGSPTRSVSLSISPPARLSPKPGSPTRSVSLSISPPASLSPKPKSPEMVAIQTASPPPLLSLPPRPVMTQLANLNCSPSLSPPSSSSPERASEKSLDSSPRIRISNVSLQNGDTPARITHFVPNQCANEKNSRSPSLSSSCSPERASEKSLGSSPRIRKSNVSIQDGESPVRLTHFVPNQCANEKNSRSPSLSSSSSPERASEKSLGSSPRIRKSNVSIQNVESPARITHFVPNQYADEQNSRSPSRSSSSSPERASEKSLASSPRIRISNVSIQNGQSPKRITYFVSYQYANKEDSRSSTVSSSSSPERPSEKSLELSPRITISNVSIQNGESPARITHANKNNSRSPSPSSFSSPERPLEKTQNSSPVISNASNQNAESLARTSSANMNELANKPNSRSPSPSSLPSPEKTQDSPARISNVSSPNGASPSTTVQKPMAASVTPPLLPPPPPPPPPAGHWESPVSIPSIRQPILKPPVLATPSRPPPPIPSPILISPVELPPSSESAEKNEETPKPKLKPLHWDKVRASSDREMVWDQLKSSSFILNEEMIETLFVVKTRNSKEPTRSSVLPSPIQENRVLDPKKAQNIAISLRALNVTIEEVCDALSEGNAEALGSELLESLLKMAPTKEEERRLKEYKDDSPIKLGTAERFLKAVLDIPFAFRRVDAMLYVANFESEVEYLKRSFGTLEAACEELRNSRMFLKLLEAVLKTGNRMNVGTNRGDAQAFKLDTLLKLIDVKGTDGRTTLLHFVVQEIIRSEGDRLSEGNNDNNQNPKSTLSDEAKCRKLGLQVVSGLSLELMNVKKAAMMDSDVLSSDVMKLSRGIGNIAEIVRLNEGLGSEEKIRKFSESMKRFVKMGEEEIIKVQAHESVALSLVKEITEYFHGNSAKEEAHPFRIFMVVRDFLTVLDRVCKEVGMINEKTTVSSAHRFPVPVNPMLQPVVGGSGRRQFSSFDGEIASP